MSLWQYDRDGVTQSFLKKFRECKLQCRLEYVDGWTSNADRIWFRYGHLIHHLLQHVYEKEIIDNEPQAYHLAHDYAEKEGWFKPDVAAYIQDENAVLCSIAQKILPSYCLLNLVDIHNSITLDTEKEYRLELRDTFLRGKLDRVYKEANDEEIVVRDYKTTSRKINSEELRNEYKLDTQTYAYLTLAAAKWELIPNRMEYTFLKTPSYSFARKKVGTTNLDWLEKVKQAIEKTPSEWFTTIKLNVSAQNLQQWRKEQLIPMLDEVRDWWRSGCPGFPYNEQSLRTKFNSKCTMYDLIVFGQTSNYYKRTKAFSEYVV